MIYNGSEGAFEESSKAADYLVTCGISNPAEAEDERAFFPSGIVFSCRFCIWEVDDVQSKL